MGSFKATSALKFASTYHRDSETTPHISLLMPTLITFITTLCLFARRERKNDADGWASPRGDGTYIYRRLIRYVNGDTKHTAAPRATSCNFIRLHSCGIPLMPFRPTIVAAARKILMNKNFPAGTNNECKTRLHKNPDVMKLQSTGSS